MPAQKKSIHTEQTSTELEFEIHDDTCFFIRASERCECHVKLEEMVHGSDDRLLEFFRIKGIPPDEILAIAEESDAIEVARLIRETDEGCLFEFAISGPCVGETLADAGAVVREVIADNGVGHVVAYVPPHVEKRAVIEQFQERHGGELLACREMNRPAPEFTRQEFREAVVDQLTDRQFEALQTAYASGYYTWPRESTAEDCAEALDIAQPTFTQHLRTAQEKLLLALFETLYPDDAPHLYR